MSASALVQLVMRGFISKPEIHVDLHHIQVKQMFADLDTRREENITEELRKELLDPAYLDHISQLAWDEFQQKTLS